MVSSAFFVLAVLVAADAGRPGESGTGAMWIAPELVEAAVPIQACGHATALRSREITFEHLQPGEADDLPRLLAGSAREVVDFEWNAATGELTFSTSAATGVFSDLAAVARVSDATSVQSCGSR